MINITERAQAHFRHLIEQRDTHGLSIRLRVTDGGTPKAQCELTFCEPSELNGSERGLEYAGFKVYIGTGDVRWLEAAEIDFMPAPTAGQLNIRAPNIKGHVPDVSSSLIERVQYVIDAEINPQIALHGGRVSLVEVSQDNVVVLQFGGGCHGCGMAGVTLKQTVETTLRARIPEITAVCDATDHASGENPYFERYMGRLAMRRPGVRPAPPDPSRQQSPATHTPR